IWDPFKHIPIDNGPHGPSYLSMGGELRERFEDYNHINFGIGTGKLPTDSSYDLHRLQINADLHLTDYFRAFVQFAELDRVGRRGVTSTTDI
ncbi:alginate export family protein, partial [Shewanella algae]|uniref:alginate export family protein n=1 Tax=Shewanella algae TaxID=38313 RepID=UPI00313CF5D3